MECDSFWVEKPIKNRLKLVSRSLAPPGPARSREDQRVGEILVPSQEQTLIKPKFNYIYINIFFDAFTITLSI